MLHRLERLANSASGKVAELGGSCERSDVPEDSLTAGETDGAAETDGAETADHKKMDDFKFR